MQTHAILIALAVIQSGVFASPMNETGPEPDALAGWGYATFYDDNACTKNPGKAVSIGNAGCLANEIGRNSIYIQPGDNMSFKTASLVWSPGTTCNCQNECKAVNYNNGNNYCWNLNGNKAADSFRFITQGCAGNNC